MEEKANPKVLSNDSSTETRERPLLFMLSGAGKALPESAYKCFENDFEVTRLDAKSSTWEIGYTGKVGRDQSIVDAILSTCKDRNGRMAFLGGFSDGATAALSFLNIYPSYFDAVI